MRVWKKRLASALIVSMLATGMSLPSFAEGTEGSTDAGVDAAAEGITIATGKVYDEKGKVYFANGNPVTVEERDGKTYVHLNEDDVFSTDTWQEVQPEDVIVAGSQTGDVSEGSITMTGGEVTYLVGSSSGTQSNNEYSLDSSEITMTGGYAKFIYMNRPAANGSNWVVDSSKHSIGNAKVTLAGDAKVDNLFGCFSYSAIDNLEMNLYDDAVVTKDLFPGATNGQLGTATINVNGAGVEIGELAGCQRTLVDELDINLIKGKVNEVIAIGALYNDQEWASLYKTSKEDNEGNKTYDYAWGNVQYGVVKDTDLFIGKDFEYRAIYGGFQYIPEEIKAFQGYLEEFKKLPNDNLSNILESYGIEDAVANNSTIESKATIRIAAAPKNPAANEKYKYLTTGGEADYSDIPNLLTDKVEGVTVTYMPAGLKLDKTEEKMSIGDKLDLTATVEKLASASTATRKRMARTASPSVPDIEDPDTTRVEWETSDEEIINLVISEDDTEENGEIITKSVQTVEAIGEGTATVTAKLIYGTGADEIVAAQESCKITVKAPEFKLDKTSVTLDMNNGAEPKTLKLTRDGKSDGLDELRINASMADEAVAVAELSEAKDEITITPLKKGETKLTVEIGEFDKKLTVNITVKDTRKISLSIDGKPVNGTINTFDLNEASENFLDKVTVQAESDYEDAELVWTIDGADEEEPVADITDSFENEATIMAMKEGVTTLHVMADGYPESELLIEIVVKDSSKKAEVGAGTSDVTTENAETPEPTVEAELNEEQQQALAEEHNKVVEEVKKSVAENKAVQNAEVKLSNNAESAVATLLEGKLSDGEKAVISTSQELKKIETEAVVTYKKDEAGNDVVDTVKPVIKSITYSVNPMYQIYVNDEATGEKMELENFDRQFSITFRLPVPASVETRSAKVDHVSEKHGTTTSYETIREADGAKYIEIRTTHFSDFVLTFTNDKPQSGSSSGGGSTGHTLKANGSWHQDSVGWWFAKTGGGYPADQWYECYWNGQMHWYHFNAQGYLDAGWFTDKDGATYYLHNQHDNQFGYMYTGWNWIDGKCYYFTPNTIAGGPKQGMLYKNGITPDGYSVNETGAWTVDGAVQTK